MAPTLDVLVLFLLIQQTTPPPPTYLINTPPSYKTATKKYCLQVIFLSDFFCYLNPLRTIRPEILIAQYQR